MNLSMRNFKILILIFFIAIAVYFLLHDKENLSETINNVEDFSKEEILSKEIFGMKIEQVSNKEEGVEILTTGAKFLLQDDGILHSWQRIPAEREVAKLKIPLENFPFEITEENGFTVVFSGQGLDLVFQGDSLVIIRPKKEFDIFFTGLFNPVYQAGKEGKWIFIDSVGGFGVYPVEKKQTQIPEVNNVPWNLKYSLTAGEEIWFSVFPPRPYNWERVFEQVAHTGKQEEPYSPDDLISSAAKHAKVFALHSFFWPGGDREPWLIPSFIPSDMNEFIRVRDEVHKNGMKFVVYMSPYYSTAPDFFAEMKRALEEYEVDGVYFDGISFDFRESYRIIRQAREILGNEKILYVHSSTDPFNSITLYAPFIDTYADYMLRGEAGRPAGTELEDFLHWTVSGYNISNTIGYWLHYGSGEIGQPDYVFTLPSGEDIDSALANHVYFCWSDTMYRDAPTERLEEFRKEYYQKLELYRQQYLK